MTSKVSFNKLDELEVKSRFFQLAQKKNNVTVWLKGSSYKEELFFIDSEENKLRIFLSYPKDKNILNKDIFFTFEINGVKYFSKAFLKDFDSKKVFLDWNKDEIYKSERRNSFRLFTNPNYEVYLYVKIEDEYISQNIVDFRVKQSQTALFKSFLKLVNEDEKSLDKEGYVHFRVNDISVTGLSLEVSELEKKFFIEKKKTGKAYINFSGEEFPISNCEIVYVIDAFPKKGVVGRSYKVGIKFLDTDIALDHKLGNLINKSLSDEKEDFEEFLE